MFVATLHHLQKRVVGGCGKRTLKKGKAKSGITWESDFGFSCANTKLPSICWSLISDPASAEAPIIRVVELLWWIAGVGWVGQRRIYLVNIQGIPMDCCLHTLSIKEFKGWQGWNFFCQNSVTELRPFLAFWLHTCTYSIKDFQRVTGETVCKKMQSCGNLSLEGM